VRESSSGPSYRHRSATVTRSPGFRRLTEVRHATPFFSDMSPPSPPGFMANDDDRNVHYLADEGITWVHGHVDDDSPEGKALIAAHALAGGRLIPASRIDSRESGRARFRSARK
jgi:hypothetical protein